MTRQEIAYNIMLALVQNPAIYMPVPSALNPKMAQLQIVVEPVETAYKLADAFLSSPLAATPPTAQDERGNG